MRELGRAWHRRGMDWVGEAWGGWRGVAVLFQSCSLAGWMCDAGDGRGCEERWAGKGKGKAADCGLVVDSRNRWGKGVDGTRSLLGLTTALSLRLLLWLSLRMPGHDVHQLSHHRSSISFTAPNSMDDKHHSRYPTADILQSGTAGRPSSQDVTILSGCCEQCFFVTAYCGRGNACLLAAFSSARPVCARTRRLGGWN